MKEALSLEGKGLGWARGTPGRGLGRGYGGAEGGCWAGCPGLHGGRGERLERLDTGTQVSRGHRGALGGVTMGPWDCVLSPLLFLHDTGVAWGVITGPRGCGCPPCSCPLVTLGCPGVTT